MIMRPIKTEDSFQLSFRKRVGWPARQEKRGLLFLFLSLSPFPISESPELASPSLLAKLGIIIKLSEEGRTKERKREGGVRGSCAPSINKGSVRHSLNAPTVYFP